MSGIGECADGGIWNGFRVQGGIVDRFNNAKRAEVNDRVKHVRMEIN